MNTAVATELPLEATTSEERPAKQRRGKSAEKAHVTNVEAEVMPPEIGTAPATGTAVATVTTITPMQMLQTALEKGVDLEQMQQLMDLQERWEKNEARKAYVAAMAAFKADPPSLLKNKQVKFKNKDGSFTEYKHATLDQVAGLIGSAMSAHGLSFAWKTEQLDGGQIKVTCTVTHVKGHSESTSLQSSRDQSGGKNDIQAVGSTVSYLERYTLLALAGLATSDQDDDGAKSELDDDEFISTEQKDELIGLIKETRTSTPKYLDLLGVPSVDEIPAQRFNEALQVLEARKREQGR